MKCPEEVSGSSEKPFIPSLNVVPVDTDIPSSSMHLSEKKGPSGSDTKISCFEGQEDIHDSRSLLKTAATSSCPVMLFFLIVTFTTYIYIYIIGYFIINTLWIHLSTPLLLNYVLG